MTYAAEDPRHGRRLSWALLAVLTATAVGTLTVMAAAAGGVETLFTGEGAVASVLFTAWNLAPIAAMAFVVVLTRKLLPRAVWVTAVGVVLLATATAWAFVDFTSNESSTAALMFVFLPIYQFLAVGVSFAAAAVVHSLRTRRTRSQAPGA